MRASPSIIGVCFGVMSLLGCCTKSPVSGDPSGKDGGKAHYHNVYSWECTNHTVPVSSSQSWSDADDPDAKKNCQADMDAHDSSSHGGAKNAVMKWHPVPDKP